MTAKGIIHFEDRRL